MAGSARETILNVAGNLFFKQGYRVVGIDTIIAESGVAKATLYRHFASKDDLIAAYLQETNVRFWAWFDNAAEPYPDQPRQQIIAVFEALQKLVTTPTCYGCPFLMAATEFPDPGHPGHQIALENKEAVRARFLSLCEQAGLRQPQIIADQLVLLMDGAFMAVRLYGIDNPAVRVGESARLLVDCAV